MNWKVTTPPGSEPVTLAEVKANSRITATVTAQDSLISDVWIPAARRAWEHMADQCAMSQTITLRLDAFPVGSIVLPRGKATAITSITYTDAANTTQTVSTSVYALNASSDRVQTVDLKMGQSWPSAGNIPGAVSVVYTAGHATAPEDMKHWILLAVGRAYENREAGADREIIDHAFFDRLADQHWRAEY